jgi:Mrp family chromosome partitioning ATPase
MTIESVMAALAGVPDPSGGDIVAKGRVQAPRLNDGVASIILDVTGLSADVRANLERRIRAAMVAVPAVKDIRIAMTADKVERRIVAIGSGKGGVGKSTLSANLAVAQTWKPAGAVIVSTPQDLALIDATRAIDLFRKMDVPVIGLVENMAGYECPHCGELSDPFGSGGAEAAAKVMSIPFLGRVPLTLNIRRSSDSGHPPAAGDDEEAAIFMGLARKLLEQLQTA